MSTANTSLRVSELDFESIRNNLKTFLRSQNTFSDYDFEGSGMSVLLDILAYNTHYMGYYLNMAANEMFIDTAQLRNSIISHSKLMNYVPKGHSAPVAVVNIKITPQAPEDLVSQTLTLDRYTNFLSEPVDGLTYNFVNMHSNTTTKTANGTFEFNNVQLKQGELSTFTYTVDNNNPKRRFKIPSSQVDLDTVSITIQESSVNTMSYVYSRATDLTEVTANSQVYWIEENTDKDGTYTVYFGDGLIGQRLIDGNLVQIRYIDTQGPNANKANLFSAVQSIGTYSSNVRVTSVTAAAGGSDKETIEEIRFRAPIHYTVQNRAVTVNDYESLILKDYSYVDSASVWGGEDNDPPIYGKIFIALKPKENYEISLVEKERIKKEILENRSILTVIPEIVDPNYVYLIVRADIQYDQNKTDYDDDQLKSLVRAAIIDYRNLYLQKFNSTFRNSMLSKMIDNSDPAIISNNLNVFLQKRFEPTLNQLKNYILNFNTPLYKGTAENKLYSFPAVKIYDSANVLREVYYEEVPESYTGVSSVEVINSGSGYTSEPTITINGDGTGATATAKISGGKISSIEITNKGSNYTHATVSITGGNGTGAVATAVIQSQIGTLRTFYYKNNGEKVIVNSYAGDIDYKKGIIEIKDLNAVSIVNNSYYTNDTITINVKPASSLISPLRNRILDIDENDGSSIVVNAVAE